MRPDCGWSPGSKCQSAPARCYRDLDGKVCGAELRLNFTRSPMPCYTELVTQTCLNGHVNRVQGILDFVPEQWADTEDDVDGYCG